MRYFCSFPPKVTFPGCSEEFLFSLTKILKLVRLDLDNLGSVYPVY